MPSKPVIDIAGRLPSEAGAALYPAHRMRHGAHVDARGIAAFTLRGDFSGAPGEIVGCDSEPRLHFSLWLRGDVRARSEGRTLRLRASQAVIAFQPGVPWETRYDGRVHNVGLLLRPRALAELAGDEGGAYLRRLERGGGVQVEAASVPALRAAQELDAALLDPAGSALLREAKALELLAHLLRPAAADAAAPAGARRRRLEQARELLLADLSRAPTLAELARACGLNGFALKQGFRALFGISAHALFQQERMRLAWRLIESGEASVSEAGERVGYTSLSHFSIAFRKAFGVLPGELKRRAHSLQKS